MLRGSVDHVIVDAACDPLEFLVCVYLDLVVQNDGKIAVDEQGRPKPAGYPIEIRQRAAAEVAQYKYPKKKAIEVTQGGDRPDQRATRITYGWQPRLALPEAVDMNSSVPSSTILSPASDGSTSSIPDSRDSAAQ